MIETIKIAHPELSGEYMVINAADFNAALHVLFVEVEPVDDPAKKAKGKGKKPPTANAALLAKIKPNGEDEGEGEGDPGEQGDLGLDETTTD